MQWIDKESVLSFGGKDIAYGDEIPKSLDETRLKELQKAGKIGGLPKEVDPKALETNAIKDLEKKVKALERKNTGYKNDAAAAGEKLKVAGENNLGLTRALDESEKKVKALEKEVTKLSKKEK